MVFGILLCPLWWSRRMEYKDSASLASTFKAWLKCTWNFELASGITGLAVPGRSGSWVGLGLVRLKGGAWLRNTVDRQRCTVSFIAFSCESYGKKRGQFLHVVPIVLSLIWFSPSFQPALISPTNTYQFSNVNFLTSKFHSDTLTVYGTLSLFLGATVSHDIFWTPKFRDICYLMWFQLW